MNRARERERRSGRLAMPHIDSVPKLIRLVAVKGLELCKKKIEVDKEKMSSKLKVGVRGQ